MKQEQFNIEIEVVQKPKVAVLPFIWNIIKGWVFKNWQPILMLLLKVAFQKYGSNSKAGQAVLEAMRQMATQKAMLSGSCLTPKPLPKLEPGYWECQNNEWVWVPIVLEG